MACQIMSESKVQCTSCGTEILAATALCNDGLCMPCKDGDTAPEWRRRQLWQLRGVESSAGIPWYRSPWSGEVIATCRAIVSGEIEPVEGSRKMARFSEIVLDAAHGDKWLHRDWAPFFETPDSERVRSAALNLLKEENEASA